MGRTLSALVLAAGVALVGGCGGGQDTSGPLPASPGPARPAVKPVGNIVPLKGGADVPEPTLAVCRKCQRELERGRNATLAASMDRVASEAEATGEAGPESSTKQSSTKAVALLCSGVAKTNLGRYHEAIKSLEAADKVRQDLPSDVRPQLLELLYHAQLISYIAVGDHEKVEEVLAKLLEVGRDPAAYTRQACAVASAPASIPECAGATPTTSRGTMSPGTGSSSPDERNPRMTPTETGPSPGVTEIVPTGGGTEPGDTRTGPADTGPPATNNGPPAPGPS
jgi:hypothetical protein